MRYFLILRAMCVFLYALLRKGYNDLYFTGDFGNLRIQFLTSCKRMEYHLTIR